MKNKIKETVKITAILVLVAIAAAIVGTMMIPVHTHAEPAYEGDEWSAADQWPQETISNYGWASEKGWGVDDTVFYFEFDYEKTWWNDSKDAPQDYWFYMYAPAGYGNHAKHWPGNSHCIITEWDSDAGSMTFMLEGNDHYKFVYANGDTYLNVWYRSTRFSTWKSIDVLWP